MYSSKVAEAVIFASMAHDKSYRKGSEIPYIAHPMETGLIVMSMTKNEDVIIAAILHDVAEDTDYSLEDIREKFGDHVAELVSYESEDKMKNMNKEDSWKIRKMAFLEHLESAPKNAKMICLADKVSNMRQSAKDHEKMGDDMWLVFNQKDKNEQMWYYQGIARALMELKNTKAFEEYIDLGVKVFGEEFASILAEEE